jgi:hypothetical protein
MKRPFVVLRAHGAGWERPLTTKARWPWTLRLGSLD